MSPRTKFTGTCRFCGCSASEDETRACVTPTGDPCWWFDFERTCCSNPPCIRQWQNERAKFKAERKARERKPTPAEIHALICRRNRHAKKKAGAA